MKRPITCFSHPAFQTTARFTARPIPTVVMPTSLPAWSFPLTRPMSGTQMKHVHRVATNVYFGKSFRFQPVRCPRIKTTHSLVGLSVCLSQWQQQPPSPSTKTFIIRKWNGNTISEFSKSTHVVGTWQDK